jgi:hypothetical protein
MVLDTAAPPNPNKFEEQKLPLNPELLKVIIQLVEYFALSSLPDFGHC